MYVLCSDKKENSAENPASPEQLLRVIREAVSRAIVLSLVQIRLFSLPLIDWLLTIFIDITFKANLKLVPANALRKERKD